jgi:hypothetical protein
VPVTRDFIPEAADASEQERDRFERARQSARGNAFRDFIPGADHELQPPSGSAQQADEALERALARQATAAKDEFDAMTLKLKDLSVAETISLITKAPVAVQEMALVAEALSGNRSDILDHFGPVDPAAVKRWTDISGAPKAPRRRTNGGKDSSGDDTTASATG